MSGKGAPKKSKEMRLDNLLKGNKVYMSIPKERVPIIAECINCKKWRKVPEYKEDTEVPEKFVCRMTTIDGEEGNCNIPSNIMPEEEYEAYVPGSIVWAKLGSYPWWPAMVEDDPDREVYHVKLAKTEEFHVVFLGDKRSRQWIRDANLRPFKDPKPSESIIPKWNKSLAIAKQQAEEAVKMPLEERIFKFSFATAFFQERNKKKNTVTKTDASAAVDAALRTSGLVQADGSGPSTTKGNTAQAYGVEPSTSNKMRGHKSFVLPLMSAHSARKIIPRKRYRDEEDVSDTKVREEDSQCSISSLSESKPEMLCMVYEKIEDLSRR